MIVFPRAAPSGESSRPAGAVGTFDRAVQRLGIAMEGQIMYVVAFRYRDLAAVMHKTADLLLGETPDTRTGR